jgi:hypothetical protein
MKRVFAAAVALLGLAGPLAAQGPVAVVEDVQGKVTGVEFMDYVAPGKVIKLGPDSTVVIGYMKSCWRETITGIGTVIVGQERSMVHLGEIKSTKVDCDTHARSVDQAVGESAATIVRSLAPSPAPAASRFTLHGLSPMVETRGHGRLVVERLDIQGERYEVDLSAASVIHGRFYDFAKSGTALQPGGTYAMSLGSQRRVFVVDREAEPGPAPIIGRLVRLE